MRRELILLITVGCSSVVILGKSVTEWKSKVIYQVLTDRFARVGSQSSCTDLTNYCGGTFRGLANKLDYIQDLGANAIWISPVIENTDGGYHGYWAKNIFKINSHFGSSDDLKALVDECHRRGIWVMVDVVANHMGYPPGCPACSMQQRLNFSTLVPFNKSDHYHPYCEIQDWNDQHQVEVCRLAQLPDLNQDNSYVRQTLKTWIQNLTREYDFDGIRIDTIPEVGKDFWSEFTQSAGVFSIGEVDNGDIDYNAGYQGPLNAVLNYPMYFTLRQVYQEKNSPRFISQALQTEAAKFKDTTDLGGFLDNHDNPRFLCINGDWTALKNGLVYSLMAKWIPIVYYGTEQGYAGCKDPGNRESLWPNYNTQHDMYQFISAVLKFRSNFTSDLVNSEQRERWVDDKLYVFTRGPKEEILVVTTTQGSGSTDQVTIPNLPFSDNTVLQNIFDVVDQVKSSDGRVTVQIQNGQPKIYHVIPTTQMTDTNNRERNTDTSMLGTVLTVSCVIGALASILAGVNIYRVYSARNGYTVVNKAPVSDYGER